MGTQGSPERRVAVFPDHQGILGEASCLEGQPRAWRQIVSSTRVLSDPPSAFLVETYIDLCQGWSKLTANVPRWGWLIVSMFSAAAVQRIVAWLHVRFGGAPAAAKIPRAPGAGQKAKTS